MQRLLLLPAALVVLLLAAPPAQAGELVDIAVPARNGELPPEWVVRYPKGDGPRAKVLLPDGYDPRKAYPLLVLLIGLQSHYSDWSDRGQGEIEKTAAGFPGIIVMPEGGDGWYADWFAGGRRDGPRWESYVLDQVLPQVQERYRILPERRHHALAGVSMGGLGSAYLGGRLPGYFGSIAVFSGFVDTQIIPGIPLFQAAISYFGAARPPTDPLVLYGPPGGPYERGHNPAQLAANLQHTRVFLMTGDGSPLVQEPVGTVVFGGIIGQTEELAIIRPMSDSYAAALRSAGVDLEYHVREGNHDWRVFRDELRRAIAWGFFEPVEERPSSWVNDTVATHGQLWDVAYRFDAPPDRIVRFRRRQDVLTVSGAGTRVALTTAGGCTLHVATPARLQLPDRPCAGLSLRVRPRTLAAGASRRIIAQVSPAVEGVVVRLGTARAVTDRGGVARLRGCLSRPGVRRVRATVADRLPGTARVRVRGPARACP